MRGWGQHAHRLLDQLDPGQFQTVVRLLEVLTEPPAATIGNAPIDDEPVYEEEERAVAASKEWFRNNEGIPLEDVVAELGLSMEQISGQTKQGMEVVIPDRLLRSPSKQPNSGARIRLWSTILSPVFCEYSRQRLIAFYHLLHITQITLKLISRYLQIAPRAESAGRI